MALLLFLIGSGGMACVGVLLVRSPESCVELPE